jgi:hypothetical protein
LATASASRAAAFDSVRDGLLLPDEGDVLPDDAAAPVGFPVFSIAFAAVTFAPAAGASLSTFSFAADAGPDGVDAAPMLRTFVFPALSVLGVVSPPIDRTFAFGAVSPPMLRTLAFGAAFLLLASAAGAGAGEDAGAGDGALGVCDELLSPEVGRLAITGTCLCWFCCWNAPGC